MQNRTFHANFRNGYAVGFCQQLRGIRNWAILNGRLETAIAASTLTAVGRLPAFGAATGTWPLFIVFLEPRNACGLKRIRVHNDHN
jgi:hypothetical protein